MDKKDRQTVAQVLKRRRQSLRLSLAEVELATRIRGKYLVKFESGDYSGLPNDIYIRGFVRNYADFLGLDSNSLLKLYKEERGEEKEAEVKAPTPVGSRRFVLTPRILIALVTAFAATAIVGYLYLQFSDLAAPPKLEVSTPVSDQVIYGSLIDVAGHASGGSDVFINDSAVLTDANGNFSEKLALQDGVNTVRIVARNKVGKSSAVSRNILAHLPKLDATQASVPAATFDGVAVAISIKGSAVGLVVTAGNQEVFRGTMLDGTSQVFKANQTIKITTSNAGATYVVVTNKNVANKSLGAVGNNGEAKRDLEFSKDTQFP